MGVLVVPASWRLSDSRTSLRWLDKGCLTKGYKLASSVSNSRRVCSLVRMSRLIPADRFRDSVRFLFFTRVSWQESSVLR